VRACRRSHIPRHLFHRWFVFLPVVALLAAIPFLLPEVASPTRPTHRPVPATMQPTIRPGEVVLVDHGYYPDHLTRRGDLAVFLSPHDEAKLLKRVIALPGERVEMRDGRAIIDGDPTLDQWAHLEGEPLSLPFVGTVPPGELFVLGDFRHNSRDSRSFGFVTEDRLLGRAESIYFSEDLDRIGLRLHD
jgi:signal peptidase I